MTDPFKQLCNEILGPEKMEGSEMTLEEFVALDPEVIDAALSADELEALAAFMRSEEENATK